MRVQCARHNLDSVGKHRLRKLLGLARLGAQPNRNERGSAVVRLRFAAVASVGCMGPGEARRPASRMAIWARQATHKRGDPGSEVRQLAVALGA
jgi:hypothetical protein